MDFALGVVLFVISSGIIVVCCAICSDRYDDIEYIEYIDDGGN